MRKTITVKYLKKIDACSEAIVWFEDQPERNIKKLLRWMARTDRHCDWAVLLLEYLLTDSQYSKYLRYWLHSDDTPDLAARVRYCLWLMEKK